MIAWEGATLTLNINGNEYNIDLSNIQFATVVKILGLHVEGHGISCYSDETLMRMKDFNGNPLRLVEKEPGT